MDRDLRPLIPVRRDAGSTRAAFDEDPLVAADAAWPGRHIAGQSSVHAEQASCHQIRQASSVFRVAIYGNSGSGKSLLAGQLAERLGVPHIELDALAYDASGTHIPLDNLAQQFRATLGLDGWVVEGMHRDEITRVIPDADTFIWIDLPARVVGWQLISRTLRHWVTRQPRHARKLTTRSVREREIPFIVKSLRKHGDRREHGATLARLARMNNVEVIHVRSRAEASAVARDA